MTDEAYAHGTDALFDVSDEVVGADAYAHASRANRNHAPKHRCLADFAEWLPRLGPVLWLQQRSAVSNDHTCNLPRTTLLHDHPALSVLKACRQLRAHHSITAHGPREWLCFCSANGSIEARLFLLPDTNVLAWDEMAAALRIAPSAADCREPPTHSTFLGRALSRFDHRWQARLLEFSCPPHPGLCVLDVRPPLRISLLGIDIAHSVVRDAYAEWISPLHLG